MIRKFLRLDFGHKTIAAQLMCLLLCPARTVADVLNQYRGRFQKGGFPVSVEKNK